MSGGVSGPAILPMGVYLTWHAALSCSLPGIGIGGVGSGWGGPQHFPGGAAPGPPGAVEIGSDGEGVDVVGGAIVVNNQ